MKWIGLPEDYNTKFGFIYIIKNNHPEVIKNNGKKYYIGCKQCNKRIKRKPLKGKTKNRIDYKDNDVDKYWGSSKELLNDIEKYGVEHFSREVIEFCDSKFDLKYSELKWQLLTDAIFNEKFYNSIINVRLVAPKKYIDKERSIDKLKL
jgi:hypothetical protein